MHRVNSLNSALVNLGSWSTTSTSGIPSTERSTVSRMIRAASAAVSVARVGTNGPGRRGDRRAPAPSRSPMQSWGGPAASRPRSHRPGEREAGRDGGGSAQGWQGRGVPRVAGRQNVATPAGSRVAKKMTGWLFESKNHHSRHNIGLEVLEPSPSR